MPDSVEAGVMDDELQEAHQLTREDLLAKAERARPARLGRKGNNTIVQPHIVVDRTATVRFEEQRLVAALDVSDARLTIS